MGGQAPFSDMPKYHVEVASYISCNICLYTIMSPSNSHHIPINWLIDPIIPLGFPIVRWLNPHFHE